mmetsp:Transcript_19506/g.54267  ORF Transcript_19506/g.54267 Transcript_19506/m.54267 type:complete len:232 (-) Transcript_19506:818-1513(-)
MDTTAAVERRLGMNCSLSSTISQGGFGDGRATSFTERTESGTHADFVSLDKCRPLRLAARRRDEGGKRRKSPNDSCASWSAEIREKMSRFFREECTPGKSSSPHSMMLWRPWLMDTVATYSGIRGCEAKNRSKRRHAAGRDCTLWENHVMTHAIAKYGGLRAACRSARLARRSNSPMSKFCRSSQHSMKSCSCRSCFASKGCSSSSTSFTGSKVGRVKSRRCAVVSVRRAA